MQDVLDGLVSRYEQGQCSRRELLATLGMLLAVPPVQLAAALPTPRFAVGSSITSRSVLENWDARSSSIRNC
jgi:hypothetical protein